MAVQTQKKKMLYLLKVLLENTDEEHAMTANELCNELDSLGFSAERKSIYSDIETLKDFGIDIIQLKGSKSGYYIGSRQFELPELKLLVDAVQASKFITGKKSRELIKKLELFTSKSKAEQLHRQVFIANRPKADNETIYYNVDKIHNAIYRNCKIVFQYTEWTAKKELKPKRGGADYNVSPWALTWDDENYYLIAYDEVESLIKHYRVDKIQNIRLVGESRLGKEYFQNFDLASFSKKTFGMYGGRDECVTLLCENSLVGVILDHFGREVWMVQEDGEHFRTRVTVTVSRQFFGWLTGIGSGIRIKEPENVKQEYKEYLEQILKAYEK